MDDDNPQTQTQTAQQQMFGAILKVTGWKVPAVPAGRVGKLAAALLASGGNADDLLDRFGIVDPCNGWWYWRDTWQGKKGDMPNEKAIREYWLRWELPIVVVQTASAAGSLLEYARTVNSGNR